MDGLELEIGGYASVGGHLGQVQSLELASGGSFAQGEGVLLEEGVGPFGALPVERADTPEVERWLTAVRPTRAALDVGELVVEPSVRFLLDAGGFDRHTFFCGQSGSGKTYSLGTVLEQLLLRTNLRIVVLDPNSDFVRLNVPREGIPEADASRYREVAAEIVVRRAGATGQDRLHVRFTDCDAEEQGAVLRLDPIRDRGEYGALVDLLEQRFEQSAESTGELAERLLASSDAEVRALGARVRNLGIHRWEVWSTGDGAQFRISWRRMGRAASSSTSARSRRPGRRRWPPRVSSRPSGGGGKHGNRRWSSSTRPTTCARGIPVTP